MLSIISRLGRWAWGEVTDVAALWQRFWFEPESPHVVCLMRWLVGGMVLYAHLVWGLRLTEFFDSHGWLSPEAVDLFRPRATDWSFWWLVPDGWTVAVHWLCVAILFCFWIGLATPVTSKLAFVIVVSYAHRVPLANFGLDQIQTFLTLYLAIAPCGAVWSVDAWRAKRRGVDQERDLKTSAARLARRLIQVQLVVLYTYACLGKLKGEAWWDGNAVWMAAANLEYQSGSLLWMAQHPWLSDLFTHATILWEGTFWALVWPRRTRPYVLAIGTAMHLGIGAFLGMWTFGWIMIFAYVAFVRPEWLRRFDPHVATTSSTHNNHHHVAATDSHTLADTTSTIDNDDSPTSAGLTEEPLMPTRTGFWGALFGTPERTSYLEATRPTTTPSRGAIVYIDPDESTRSHALGYFRKHGFQTRTANSWSDAVGRGLLDDTDAVVLVGSDLSTQQLDEARQTLLDRQAVHAIVVLPAARRHEWTRDQDTVLASPVRMGDIRAALESTIHPPVIETVS